MKSCIEYIVDLGSMAYGTSAVTLANIASRTSGLVNPKF